MFSDMAGNLNSFSDGLKAFATGGASSLISAGFTSGIGSIFGHGGVGTLGNELLRAGAHGTFGGAMSVANGGSFWQGFAVSSLSSLAGSGMQAAGWGGSHLPFVTGVVGAGTAWAMGGDPIGGFFQGYSIGALNHEHPDEHFHYDDGDSPDTAVWGIPTVWGKARTTQIYGEKVWGFGNEQLQTTGKAKHNGPGINWGGPWWYEFFKPAFKSNFYGRTSDVSGVSYMPPDQYKHLETKHIIIDDHKYGHHPGSWSSYRSGNGVIYPRDTVVPRGHLDTLLTEKTYYNAYKRLYKYETTIYIPYK